MIFKNSTGNNYRTKAKLGQRQNDSERGPLLEAPSFPKVVEPEELV